MHEVWFDEVVHLQQATTHLNIGLSVRSKTRYVADDCLKHHSQDIFKLP